MLQSGQVIINIPAIIREKTLKCENIIKLLSEELFEDIQFSIKSENIKNILMQNMFQKYDRY